MTDYDVIVAGGGLAGTITAQSISHYSNQNLKILVIDRNTEFLPGRKSLAGWVCGDACSKEAVDFMSEKIKVQWTRPEIEHDVKGVMAFSPDNETSIPFDGAGYMLNRVKLPEIQNERCRKAGIEFEFEIRNLATDDPLKLVNKIKDYTNQKLINDMHKVSSKTGIHFNEKVNYPALDISADIKPVKKIKELKKFYIEGVIVGKAIYDGDIKLNELKELENA